MKLRPVIFCLLVIGITTTGCIFSPDNNEEEPPPVVNIPRDTADNLILNFVKAYEDRDLVLYSEVLSADYKFFTQGDEYYSYDADIAIHDKMFNEIAGTDGAVIGDITVERMEPVGTWGATPGNDPFFGGYPNSLYRPYNVLINFTLSNVDLTLKVEGLVVFYVASRDVEGSSVPLFELLGQQDRTNGSDG